MLIITSILFLKIKILNAIISILTGRYVCILNTCLRKSVALQIINFHQKLHVYIYKHVGVIKLILFFNEFYYQIFQKEVFMNDNA